MDVKTLLKKKALMAHEVKLEQRTPIGIHSKSSVDYLIIIVWAGVSSQGMI
jgi:hypothetical protein